MNYKKIECGEYNVHIIKTKDFHTIDLRVFMTEDVSKEKITYRNALIDILTYATGKYPTKQELIRKCQDLYSLRPTASVSRNGHLLVTKFGISILDSKYIEEENLLENILLLKEIILNPLVSNNKFNSKYFDIVKEDLKLDSRTIAEEPRLYANLHLLDILDDGKNILLSGYSDIDILNKMTTKSLYESYLDLIKASKIDIFISGNIKNEEKIIQMITDNFVFNNKHKDINNKVIYHNIRKPIFKVETKEYQQSKLSMGFKLVSLTEKENRYVSFVYNNIFGGGSNSMLLKTIREEKLLCYYIGSYVNRLDNVLIVNSGIHKDNYKRVLDNILKIKEDITMGKFTKKDVEVAKMETLSQLSNIKESNHSIIDYYYGRVIFDSDDLDRRIKMIKEITKEDIMSFSKKVNLDAVFFLEGDL